MSFLFNVFQTSSKPIFQTKAKQLMSSEEAVIFLACQTATARAAVFYRNAQCETCMFEATYHQQNVTDRPHVPSLSLFRGSIYGIIHVPS